MPAYFLDGSTNTLREKAQMRAKISVRLCESGITRQLESREKPSVKGHSDKEGSGGIPYAPQRPDTRGSCILCADSANVCDLPPLCGPFSSCFFLLPKIISYIMIFFNTKYTALINRRKTYTRIPTIHPDTGARRET